MFEGIVSGFLGFFDGMVSVKGFEDIIIGQRFLEDFKWFFLYFSLAQRFIDFVIFMCLTILGNLVDLKNRNKGIYSA